MKRLILVLVCAVMVFSSPAFAAKTILAGGCFWCMESDFEKLDGVSEVVSGFTGGTHENPTYEGDHTGHYEAVEITYDPKRVTYKQLMEYYWRHIDPFDGGGQFCDRGHSYKAAVFVANEQERKIAEETKVDVQKLFPDEKVVTPILDASKFYPIAGDESYHQDYYKNNPLRYSYYRWSCGRDHRVEEIWEGK